MAWTAPMTFVSNTTLTAAQLNTYLRDNMLETAPAKATTAGSHFVTAGPNQIVERFITGDTVGTAEDTTSTTFTDLATLGPTVTTETGTKAIYLYSARVSNSVNDSSRCSIDISGDSNIPAGNSRELTFHLGSTSDAGQNKFGMAFFETNLTPGTNTFQMKYRVESGTGTFGERHLIVIPL